MIWIMMMFVFSWIGPVIKQIGSDKIYVSVQRELYELVEDYVLVEMVDSSRIARWNKVIEILDNPGWMIHAVCDSISLVNIDCQKAIVTPCSIIVHLTTDWNDTLPYREWYDQSSLLYGINCYFGRRLNKTYYVVNYNDFLKVPNWTAYYVSSSDLTSKNAKRRNNFRSDSDLSVGVRSEVSDYDKSGYDKGHNAPADDFTRSIEAMSSTFLMSNMAPQNPKMNRGLWRSLELSIRKRIIRCGKGWIVTGNLFLNKDTLFIGSNKVGVPSHCYKAVLLDSNEVKKTIGYIIPNIKKLDVLEKYKVTIDSIEEVSHQDLFYGLPDSIENKIEGEK